MSKPKTASSLQRVGTKKTTSNKTNPTKPMTTSGTKKSPTPTKSDEEADSDEEWDDSEEEDEWEEELTEK